MKVKHVHQGYPSTWEVTTVERKKNKLYVDIFQALLYSKKASWRFAFEK